MKSEKKKSPKNRIVSSTVIFAVACVAFVFYVFFYCMAVSGEIQRATWPETDSSLGIGLQIIVAVILCLISGLAQLVLSAFSLIFAFLAKRLSEPDTAKPKLLIFLNFLFAAITVISYIVIMIIIA